MKSSEIFHFSDSLTEVVLNIFTWINSLLDIFCCRLQIFMCFNKRKYFFVNFAKKYFLRKMCNNCTAFAS